MLRGSAERGCELVAIRWGLIPAWAKDPAAIHSTFNARGETVHEKPAFRSAFRKRRCLVLVDGFYEWPKKPSHDRNPRYFYMKGGGAFALAGVWERWTDATTGVRIDSCAIVTTEANALLRSVPHDRMPVILGRGDWDQWLDPQVTDAAAVQPLIRQFDHGALSASCHRLTVCELRSRRRTVHRGDRRVTGRPVTLRFWCREAHYVTARLADIELRCSIEGIVARLGNRRAFRLPLEHVEVGDRRDREEQPVLCPTKSAAPAGSSATTLALV